MKISSRVWVSNPWPQSSGRNFMRWKENQVKERASVVVFVIVVVKVVTDVHVMELGHTDD